MIWAYTGTVLAVIICALAFWRGGSAERYGAAIILTGWFLTPLVDAFDGRGPGIGIMIVDIVALIALIILSLWSRKIWTLFAAAFQLAAVSSHFAAQLSSQITIFSYATGLGIWGGYGLVAALAAGVLSHERRRRKTVETADKAL